MTSNRFIREFETLVIRQLVARKKPVPFRYCGRKYYLNPDKSAAYHIQNSTQKIARMVQLIDEDSTTVFDVGANCGIFSAFTSSRLPDADIYAFEPSSELIPIIEKNCRGLNVTILDIAIGETTEKKRST
jgi:protein-L-isoaspartate O-methyltransferase